MCSKTSLNTFIALLVLCVVPNHLRAGQIQSLDVSEDVVLFSLSEEKTGSLPSCIQSGNEQMWALGLATHTDRAIYALLMTALANKSAISVESAGDCAAKEGVERPASISLVPGSSSPSEAASDGLYLYKSDGVTPVGRIAKVVSEREWLYFTPDSNTELQSYRKFEYITGMLMFLERDCQGEAFSQVQNTVQRHDNFNQGRFFRSGSESASVARVSLFSSDGVCSNNGTPHPATVYKIDTESYEHPLCGRGACIIRGGN